MKFHKFPKGRSLDGVWMILLCAGITCGIPAVSLGQEPAPPAEPAASTDTVPPPNDEAVAVEATPDAEAAPLEEAKDTTGAADKAADQPTKTAETEEAVDGEPTADEPTADEPTADEPTADEPTAEEPTAEEPEEATDTESMDSEEDAGTAKETDADEEAADDEAADDEEPDDEEADDEEADDEEADDEEADDEEADDEEEEEEDLYNWIEMSIGGANVWGNDAAFMRRHQQNGDFYGGIKSFHFEDMGDNGTLLLDGHALFGLEDYELKLDYTRDDIGFVRAGYRQFRTWYDGSGGYLPGTTTPPGWRDPITPFNDELHVDRGSVWFEAGLRMEDIPHITLGYEHHWRDGTKDSTFWERKDDAAPNSLRPAYLMLDETRDILTLDLAHTLGNTDLDGRLRYQSVRNNNTRLESRGGGPLVQQDIYKYDLYSAHLQSQTRLMDDAVLLNFGYSITSLNSDISGFRTRDTYQYPFSGESPLTGGGESVMQAINGSVWYSPVEDLVLVSAFRLAWRDQSAWDRRTNILGSTIVDSSDYDTNEQTFSSEARYTGIENVLLYSSLELSTANGNLQRSTDYTGGLERDGLRSTDSDLDRHKFVMGANWYPKSGLSISAQYYNLDSDQDFSHGIPVFLPTGGLNYEDAQLRSHDITTNDANIRVTWRALPNLSLVTRYDYQRSTIDNIAFSDLPDSHATTPKIQSGETTRHIFSENITWNVLENLYLQGGVHWISSETDTPADSALPGVVSDWDNDYWSLSLNAGYAIDDDIELRGSYYYYHADNYDGAPAGVPYGPVTSEHALNLTLTQRINSSMAWSASYGYFRGDDDGAGGYNDYKAHVVSTGFRYSF